MIPQGYPLEVRWTPAGKPSRWSLVVGWVDADPNGPAPRYFWSPVVADRAEAQAVEPQEYRTPLVGLDSLQATGDDALRVRLLD